MSINGCAGEKNILHSLMVFFCITTVGYAKIQTIVSGDNEPLAPIENHQSMLKPDFHFLGQVKAPDRTDWNRMSQETPLGNESLVYGSYDRSKVIEKTFIVRTYKIGVADYELLLDIDYHHLPLLGTAPPEIASKKLPYNLLFDHSMLKQNEKKLTSENKLSISDCYLIKAYSCNLRTIPTKLTLLRDCSLHGFLQVSENVKYHKKGVITGKIIDGL